jgi:TonB family protein
MSGPDPAKPGSSSASGPDAPPEAESDLAGLAARVSALSGSGLSDELSTDLAFEIVLNETVKQACWATGATDAFIVLELDGELVCRATTGTNAPELGERLNPEAGLSGACVKTRQMQRCEDAQSDPRADVEASRGLGISSVMILPLLRNNDLVGVFEVFSPRPSAFGQRDERALQELAQRALKNLQWASKPRLASVPDASPPVTRPEECDVAERETRGSESAAVYPELASYLQWASEPRLASVPDASPPVTRPEECDVAEREKRGSESAAVYPELASYLQWASEPRLASVPDASPPVTRPEECDVAERETRGSESAAIYPEQTSPNGGRYLDVMNFALRVDVLTCAVLLCTLVGFYWGWHRATADYTYKSKSAHASRTQQQNTSSSNASASSLPTEAAGNSASTDSLPAVGTSRPRPAVATPPAGSLLVYENGKEVFRKLPSAPGEKQSAKEGEAEHSSSAEPAPAFALSPDVAERLVHRVEPDYPEEARRQGIQGTVVLDVHIGKDGAVDYVGLVSGQAVLAYAATSAVMQWRFKPHYVDGREVATRTRITLQFTRPTP